MTGDLRNRKGYVMGADILDSIKSRLSVPCDDEGIQTVSVAHRYVHK